MNATLTLEQIEELYFTMKERNVKICELDIHHVEGDDEWNLTCEIDFDLYDNKGKYICTSISTSQY